ncbi:MAG: hypothetical protein WBE02_11960 [Bradyrhizobium sp.]
MSIFVSNHEIVITGRFGRPGALLLGQIFSLWDILAYGAGIGLGFVLDRLAARFISAEQPTPHSPS